ncbi:MAG TPA: hypothetical protein VEI74_13890 [Candidatus Methylomirabilis sp.]|nr:hypothetical protein [Candidatus Methylomirabilis sp.]
MSVHFSRFEKPMFRVAFEAERGDILPLLDFLRFIYVENVRERLLEHPLGPSHVWKAWADETYIGFSTGRIMLQSGHRFAPAELTERPSRLPWRRDRFDVAGQERAFRRYYPSWEIDPQHRSLLAAHPASYLRVTEAVALSGVTATRMLEIGAGACVHVAFRHVLNPDMRTVIIDLPETMFSGYLLLRMMQIDVALPHEDRDAAVTMRLPFQGVDGDFDFAFNMASFQEMNLETVNRYIHLIHSRLRPGGVFQHVNLRRSKQFPDNKVADYDLSGFASSRVVKAPYHSSLDPRHPVECVIAHKTAPVTAHTPHLT